MTQRRQTPPPLRGYQPRESMEPPETLPFGDSAVVASPFRIHSYRGELLGTHQVLPEAWQAMTPASAPEFATGFMRHSVFLKPEGPPNLTIGPELFRDIGRPSPLAVFVRWCLGGFSVGIILAIVLSRLT